MSKSNPLKEKSYAFSLRIIKLYKHLSNDKKEFILSKQVLRSGTSIGANIEEAEFAPSKKDFINKLNISLKEANETRYWLRLLNDSDYIELKSFESILFDIEELIKLLVSIIKTAKINEKLKM